jgi:uncharacterized protein with von Willebrand factor type A (vWA) domain
MKVQGFFLLLLCACAYAQAQAQAQHIIFLLDVSGSMAGKEASMIEGVNALLHNMEVKAESLNVSQYFHVNIYTFNNNYKLIAETVLGSKRRLAPEEYLTSGGTSLYDTIGHVLENVAKGATIIIATDGEDTTSSKFSKAQILDVIQKAKQDKNVEFVYLAQGPEAFVGGQSIGMTNTYSAPVNTPIGVNFAGAFGTVAIGASFRSFEQNKE